MNTKYKKSALCLSKHKKTVLKTRLTTHNNDDGCTGWIVMFVSVYRPVLYYLYYGLKNCVTI